MITIKIPSLNSITNEVYVPIFNNRDRYLFLYGGRNSGKSVATARKLLIRCLSEKYFRFILVKKTYESIKDSQWQTLKDSVEDLGLSQFFKFTKSPLEIECVNGNKFLARGLDKPEKIKSIKDPSGVWYEEGNQITEEDFITTTTSVRSNNAEYIQEIFSFNPETECNYEEFWLYKMFFSWTGQKSFRGQVEMEVNGKKESYFYTALHTTYKDNRFITPAQKADLESWRDINPYYYKIYTLGEWGNRDVSDRFFKNFDVLRHVKKLRLNFDLPLHISFDENVNPYPALTIWQADDKKVMQLGEICLRSPNNKLVSVAREFLRWCRDRGYSGKVYVHGDATSKKEDTKLEKGYNYFTMLESEISKEMNCQVVINKRNPSVSLSGDFINAVYDVNYDGCEILIDEDCKESINDYNLVQEKTDGTMKKPKNKDGVEVIGHCSDTKRYVLTDILSDSYQKYCNKLQPIENDFEIVLRTKDRFY